MSAREPAVSVNEVVCLPINSRSQTVLKSSRSVAVVWGNYTKCGGYLFLTC